MPGLPDCLVCPYRKDPRYVCFNAQKGTIGVCQGIAGQRGMDKVDGLRRFTIEQTSGEARPADSGIPVEVPRPGPRVSPRVALDMLRLRLGAMCANRGEKIGEGCNCEYSCALGYGWFEEGVVTDRMCMECVQGRIPRRNGTITGGMPPG